MLCQRYYYRHLDGSYEIGTGAVYSSTAGNVAIHYKQTMRAIPTLVSTTGTNYYSWGHNGTNYNTNSLNIARASTNTAHVYCTLSSAIQNAAATVFGNDASSSIAFSAEL